MPASTQKIMPPFYWLKPFTSLVIVSILAALGAIFRFWSLTSLPPGVPAQVASSALASLQLLERGQIPGFSANVNFAPGWAVLQAPFIALFGNSPEALRYLPAALGTLAVVTTWLWLRSWFGVRIAHTGALLMAVMPWVVTLSRTGSEAAIVPLVVTGCLWLITRAWRSRSIVSIVLAVLALVVGMWFGPICQLFAVAVIVMTIGVNISPRRYNLLKPPALIGLGTLSLTLAIMLTFIITSSDVRNVLPQVASITLNPLHVITHAGQTMLSMIAAGAGDQNAQHNLPGQPALNFFIGLMFIAGLLVSCMRMGSRRYRWLLGLCGLMLIPAVFTTVGIPNFGRAIGAAPFIIAFAAIGTAYLLEMWYATFPINSAARNFGQAAILVLLGLTVFQGYTQYYRAWGGSSEVYARSNEGTARLAQNLDVSKFQGKNYVISTPEQFDIVTYLTHRGPSFTQITPSQLVNEATDPGPRQFYISAAVRDETVKLLKAKFPGGVLRPHYSPFNQVEIYYTYETPK